MNKKEAQWNVGYLIFAITALVLIQSWWGQARLTEVVPYSEFERALQEGRGARVVVTERHIGGYLKEPSEQGKRVLAANLVEPDLAQRLSRFNVPYPRAHEGTLFLDGISVERPGRC